MKTKYIKKDHGIDFICSDYGAFTDEMKHYLTLRGLKAHEYLLSLGYTDDRSKWLYHNDEMVRLNDRYEWFKTTTVKLFGLRFWVGVEEDPRALAAAYTSANVWKDLTDIFSTVYHYKGYYIFKYHEDKGYVVELEHSIFPADKLGDITDLIDEKFELMTMNDRLSAKGVETLREEDGNYLLYKGKKIPRPVVQKCIEVVKREFGVNI